MRGSDHSQSGFSLLLFNPDSASETESTQIFAYLTLLAFCCCHRFLGRQCARDTADDVINE